MTTTTERRPLGIRLVAMIQLLAGISGVALALFILMQPGPLAIGRATLSGLFGVFALVLAAGTWELRPWAWFASIVWEGLTIALDVIVLSLLALALLGGAALSSMVGVPSLLIGLMIAVAIVIYLLQPPVRQLFRHSEATAR